MTETVTDIIVARSRRNETLTPMTVWSIAAHAMLIAAILLMVKGRVEEAPPTVMTISLGGAAGPRTGGLTQQGGRPVQAPAPPEPTRRAEQAPAPTRPEMTLPNPKARIVKPQERPKQAPEQATSRTPTTGAEPQAGSARAQTNARGQGFGLSSGGGGNGNGVQLDVGNFCCPEYLDQMVTLIRRNWQQNQGLTGSTVVKFTIARDGTILTPVVEQSSGFQVLDDQARRALLLTARLPPLPSAYTNPTLGLHLTFDYHR